MFECCICHQHARTTLSALLRHIREVHPHFDGKVLCGVDGCPATPSSYEGLRQHMYRFHREQLNLGSKRGSESLNNVLSDVNPELSDVNPEAPLLDDNSEEMVNDVSIDHITSVGSPATSSKILGAQFIMKTRDGRKLTQVATNGIVQDAEVLVQSTVQSMERRIFDKNIRTGCRPY